MEISVIFPVQIGGTSLLIEFLDTIPDLDEKLALEISFLVTAYNKA